MYDIVGNQHFSKYQPRVAVFACLLTLSFLILVGCEVEKTQEGEMPEVNVEAESGQMPEYNVEVADINISTTERTVQVPRVIVVMESTTVRVPVVDVKMPGETNEEMTYKVELELEGEGHEVHIEEVYLVDDKFWVISRLERNELAQTDEPVRISDQIVLNTPSEYEVRHYVIGEKPPGDHNNQYRFISSRSAIAEKLETGKAIYKQ